ncbi:MAG: FadR/GntR family transcriptional regulator [Jatrophihabitantaceae bacterium]
MDEARAATRGRLRPVRRASLYEGVLERIREYVVAEGLGKGDRLPSERDLAEQLGASRATVKQALVVLEVQGLVETRHGGGTFLRSNDVNIESVTTLLARRDRLPHVMDARIALESKVAELAAERRTAEDLAAIQSALHEMAAAVAADRDPNPGDKSFHGAIAAAARNPLLSRFLSEIENEVSESRAESLRQRGRPPQSLRQHERIADAIRDGNPRAARAAMERHLASVRKVRLLDWEIDSETDT